MAMIYPRKERPRDPTYSVLGLYGRWYPGQALEPLFKGFPHVRSKQEQREDGKV